MAPWVLSDCGCDPMGLLLNAKSCHANYCHVGMACMGLDFISSEPLLAVQEDDEAEDLDAADQDADISDESLDREEL